MSLVSKADLKLKSLYVGLLSWHFDRKSDAELSELVRQYLSAQSDQPQLQLLSDASLSDEAFESLLNHTCELLAARETDTAASPPSSENRTALELGGRPVAAVDDFDDDEEELVRARQTLPEPDRSGIDWVSVYYSLDGLIARFSLGWLSIGRVIALACVAAVVGMPFYLKQEQPLSWQQILQVMSGEDPTPVRPRNFESASTPAETVEDNRSTDLPPSVAAVDKLVENSFSSSSQASEPEELVIEEPASGASESIAIQENSTNDIGNEATESGPLLTDSPNERPRETSEPRDDSAAKLEEDPSVRLIFDGVPTGPLSQVSFEEIIDLVKANSLDTAIERIELVKHKEMYDPYIADLIKIECYLQQGTPDSRKAAWQVIVDADTQLNPSMYELQVVRWLLTSNRAERASILRGQNLPADQDLAESLLLWTEARSGSKEHLLLESLKRRTLERSQSLGDHVFLASAYFALKYREAALEELVTSQRILKEMSPDFRSPSIQWLVAQTKNDLEKQVNAPLRRIASQLKEAGRRSTQD